MHVLPFGFELALVPQMFTAEQLNRRSLWAVVKFYCYASSSKIHLSQTSQSQAQLTLTGRLSNFVKSSAIQIHNYLDSRRYLVSGFDIIQSKDSMKESGRLCDAEIISINRNRSTVVSSE